MKHPSNRSGIDSGGIQIGPGQPMFVIAEAGINHEGDLDAALALVDAAAEAGADAVKFQTFVTENVITRRAPKANYHIETTGDDSLQSWFDLIKSEELQPDDFARIKARCDERQIVFLSTPYDEPSVDLLIELGVPFIKIASTDTDNVGLLEHIGKRGAAAILSTGMSTLDEVRTSVGVLRDAGCPQLVVMQCTAEYPAPPAEANLRAMAEISEICDVAVGYSDHVTGPAAAIAAVALGACVYEKHFTLDKTLAGPDHRASMETPELAALIRDIRTAEAALGDGRKRIMPSEEKNRPILRRYLVATRDLTAGHPLARGDITAKRTGGVGIPASRLRDVLDRPLTTAIGADEIVPEDMLP